MPEGADRARVATDHGRRRFLAALATGATFGAGCSGRGATPEPSPTGTEEFADRPIEVLHGWTGGDGSRAIRSVERMFRERHPEIALDMRPVGGTANQNLSAAIDRRLANGNPPSSFASWPGPTLAQYEGRLLDISRIWEEGGLADVTHPRANQYCFWSGGYRAVPIGAHRLNTLFYRTDLLERAGIDPSSITDIGALASALATVDRETDAVPLAHAMQAPWTNLQLVGEVLLSMGGPGTYQEFVSGNGDRSTLVRALRRTKRLLEEYVNDDAPVISFTEANGKFIRGEAAAIYQGSWAYGMYRTADGHEYGTDWDWIPFPGTAGTYVANIDSFVFPRNNPTPKKKDVWASFVGTPDPQVAFSNRKGSVPVRTDVDGERLAAFPRALWTDLLETETFLPSLAHGLAVRPPKLERCTSVVRTHFSEPFDIERTADGLLGALTD